MDQLELVGCAGNEEEKGEPAVETAVALRPRYKFINREQQEFRSFALDTLIAEDHPARAIWDFLGEVDLTPYEEGIEAVEGRPGQATFEPRMLIALWLYGYSVGISSAREIARNCEHEPGLRWLCGDEPVNYHTLSDFRVQRQEALKLLFIDVLGVLSHQGLVKLERVAHDGTRIRAVASAGSFRRQATLQQHLDAAAAHFQTVEAEPGESSNARQQAARQRAAQQRQQRLEQAQRELEQIRGRKKTGEKAEARVSESEPEARMLKLSEGGFAPAYNVQVSSDREAGLIVNAEVTQSGSDYAPLVPALEQVKENFGRLPDQVLVDGGFLSRENIEALDGRTDLIGPYDPEGRQQAQRQRAGIAVEFAASVFVWDEGHRQFRCPAGAWLTVQRSREYRHKVEHTYQAPPQTCAGCVHKPQCCPKTAARTILQIEEGAAVQRFREKMRRPEVATLYRQRAQVAEFPFCWWKEKFGFRRFRVRGLIKARSEVLWYALAYNIRQWIRLRWQPHPASTIA